MSIFFGYTFLDIFEKTGVHSSVFHLHSSNQCSYLLMVNDVCWISMLIFVIMHGAQGNNGRTLGKTNTELCSQVGGWPHIAELPKHTLLSHSSGVLTVKRTVWVKPENIFTPNFSGMWICVDLLQVSEYNPALVSDVWAAEVWKQM